MYKGIIYYDGWTGNEKGEGFDGMIGLYLTLIDTEEDKSKFAVLYEKYRRLMFYIAKKILQNDHLAEDAVQEAFLRIARNFHKVGEIDSPRTRAFVVIITRNATINTVNRENRMQKTYAALEKEAQGVGYGLLETVSYDQLVECILWLPEPYRDVLYLKHIYGYSFREISELLSITVDAAKKRAQRARERLEQMLKEDG